jgi:hypothetical protein
MKSKWIGWSLAAIAAIMVGALLTGGEADAQRRRRVRLNYNARANYGQYTLQTGFTPDPWGFPITAGGGRNPIDVSQLGLSDSSTGQACSQSYVTRNPDFHFTFRAGSQFSLVRFYVVTQNNADATLLINQPDTRWRCNDDHGRGDWGNRLMPAVDFANPQSGRYDIWVGSYDMTSRNPGTLYVTELDSNHP